MLRVPVLVSLLLVVAAAPAVAAFGPVSEVGSGTDPVVYATGGASTLLAFRAGSSPGRPKDVTVLVPVAADGAPGVPRQVEGLRALAPGRPGRVWAVIERAGGFALVEGPVAGPFGAPRELVRGRAVALELMANTRGDVLVEVRQSRTTRMFDGRGSVRLPAGSRAALGPAGEVVVVQPGRRTLLRRSLRGRARGLLGRSDFAAVDIGPTGRVVVRVNNSRLLDARRGTRSGTLRALIAPSVGGRFGRAAVIDDETSSTGRVFAAADGRVRLFWDRFINPVAGRLLYAEAAPGRGFGTAVPAPNGGSARGAAAARDGRLAFAAGNEVRLLGDATALIAPVGTVEAVAFSADGTRLVAAGSTYREATREFVIELASAPTVPSR